MEEQSALSYLRELGLTIDISEHTATEIKGRLLIVHGRLFQGHYDRHPTQMTFDHFYAAYHAIAEGIVTPSTRDETLAEMIPAIVENFSLQHQWRRVGDLNRLKQILRGPIAEWSGNRLMMRSAERSTRMEIATVTGENVPTISVPLPTCAQLRELRKESHLEFEELAEALDVAPRSVYRHFSGESVPYGKHLARYQEIFSEKLGRKVLISRTSGKCQ
jgi:hypothetical protein